MSNKDSNNECVEASKVSLSELMIPNHANPGGNVHGGTIMKIIDEAAYIAAARHTHRYCVTASVDHIDFISPVFIGNVVNAKASVNYASKHSMEIGVRVEAESLQLGKITHVASAYLTFVAIDENKRPVEISPVKPITDEEIRRYKDAEERRKIRKENLDKKRQRNEGN